MTAPLYLARHAETVYNAGARMQGHMAHTPLTHAGIAQAHSMGDALRAHFGAKPDIDLWASPSGRTLQTMAVVAEHLGRDFFDVRKDDRLLEIDVGDWEGRLYGDIIAESGPTVDHDRGLLRVPPPGGDWLPAISARPTTRLAALDSQQGIELLLDRLRKTKTNYEFLTQVQQTATMKLEDEAG